MHATRPECRPAQDRASLDRAEALLRAGECVALPTETVYGLACDATSSSAVAKVYAIKGRPSFNPLIAHVDGLERAMSLIEMSSTAQRLAEVFWPGPLTLVGRMTPNANVCDLVSAGLETLAVRWPRSKAMTALITRLDRPLAAPSANPSGAISPTRPEHVQTGLSGKVELCLDDGPCPVGLESTIIDCTGEKMVLLRPGGTSRDAIEDVLGHGLQNAQIDPNAPIAPGQLSSHYAPSARVRLDVATPKTDEGWLAFGPVGYSHSGPAFNLSEQGNLVEAASRLFEGLHYLDARCTSIVVSPIPKTGLGEALNDRLRRAAAPS